MRKLYKKVKLIIFMKLEIQFDGKSILGKICLHIPSYLCASSTRNGMDHHRFMGANWCVIATFPVAHPHNPRLLEALKLAKAMFLLTLAYLI